MEGSSFSVLEQHGDGSVVSVPCPGLRCRGYASAGALGSCDTSKEAIQTALERGYPLLRSITGKGVRDTHSLLAEVAIPELQTFEIPSGTKCLDWKIPPEWECREAYLVTPSGEKILDVKTHGLHLLNYSTPVAKGTKMTLAELEPHLYSLPRQPDLIPYVTSYYKERWGFCLSQLQREKMQKEGAYEVFIDSLLNPSGSLTLSEVVLPGETEHEIFFSSYTCHPHMLNDSFSGVLAAAFLYAELRKLPKRKFTYRFAFIPETVGAIAYLSLQENGVARGQHLKEKLLAGFALSCIGDKGEFSYKKSRRENDPVSGEVEKFFAKYYGEKQQLQGASTTSDESWQERIYPYWPSGSDERQYCSLAFDLPVGGMCRTFYSVFEEYHTSADNLELVSGEKIHGSVQFLLQLAEHLENSDIVASRKSFLEEIRDEELKEESSASRVSAASGAGARMFRNLLKHGEPQLGPRGLYNSLGSIRDSKMQEASSLDQGKRIDAFMWLLAYSDGRTNLQRICDIGEQYGKKFLPSVKFADYRFQIMTVAELAMGAEELLYHKLIEEVV